MRFIHVVIRHIDKKWPDSRDVFGSSPTVGSWLERKEDKKRYTILDVIPDAGWGPDEAELLRKFGARVPVLLIVKDEEPDTFYPCRMQSR